MRGTIPPAGLGDAVGGEVGAILQVGLDGCEVAGILAGGGLLGAIEARSVETCSATKFE